MHFGNPHRRGRPTKRLPSANALHARTFWLRLEHLEQRTLLHAAGLDHVPVLLPAQHELFDYDGYLTGPSTASARVIAETYLRSQSGALGIVAADLDNYIVTTNYLTDSSGATTLTFQQSFHGKPVANANFNMTVSASGQLLNVGGGFVSGLSQRAAEQPPAPQITIAQAIGVVAGALEAPLAADPTMTANPDGTWTASGSGLSLDPIKVKSRYVAMNDHDVALSWNLTVRTPDNAHWFNIDVDASNGQVIAAVDYVHSAGYEVSALPTENLGAGPRTVAMDPNVFLPTPAVIPSPFGWHDTNGVAGPEFTITRGNNVNAFADRDADLVPDSGSQPDGGPSLNFTGPLVPIDVTQQPETYIPAAVTNLFYWNNILHDVHYLYGFTEAARNFQANTYGRGGIGNDAVGAHAQFGAAVGILNNAAFATPPDGEAPFMVMFEWDLTSPRRDSDLDNGVIIHEYGHGVSNRLTGNGDGLNATQSGGMGEGWSDWWALMLTQQNANETTNGRGVGTYLLGEPLSGQGIREFRYKFDIANQNLETFLNYGTGPGQSIEPHDAGTRWAAALWDVTHLFEQKYGFEPNVYNSTSGAGNTRALHLIMNALKIQPLNPSFISGRDAILMADRLLYNGANQFEIWTAFARRGLGEFAATPSAGSATLTTSFAVPDAVKPKVSVGDVSKHEGDNGTTDFVFTVSLSAATGQQVTVEFTTLDGTASAPADYLAQSGTLTFQGTGPETRTVTIQVAGNTEVEAHETFSIKLSNVTNAALGRSQALGTIRNDDIDFSINDVTVVEGNSGTNNAVFTISTFGSVDREVAVSYTTLNGTAVAAGDYLPRGGAITFAPGGGAISITVPIVGDVFSESTETFSMLLLSPQAGQIAKSVGIGTILDNDPIPSLYVNDVHVTTTESGVRAAVFTVALDAPSGQIVTVNLATADSTAQAGTDYIAQAGVVTFSPGVTTRQVTVDVMTSAVYGPNEKFSLNLSSPLHAQLMDSRGECTIIFADAPADERIIDDGDPGYTQTAGWVNLTNTLAYQLDYDYHAAGSGASAATWSFDGLAPRQYQVFTRWIPFNNRATNAPFSILDGAAPLATLSVNQQLAPVGDQSDGLTWQSLGTYPISSGTLKVRLGANANGYVIADAVRIVADGIAPQVSEMDVAGAGRSIGTLDTSPAIADGTDFGPVAAASHSSTHTFTIFNSGNADLHLTGSPRVEVLGPHAGDFTVLAPPAAVVAPGLETTFQLIFHPSQTGLRQAIISIADDDGDEHPYTFAVQGTGGSPGPSQFTIDNFAPGYQATGNWTSNTNATSFGGQHHSAPPGQGADRVTWTYTNLAPGQYDVFATWVPFGNRATNAPFTIGDGQVSQNTFGVNQQQAPNGVFADGVGWGRIASLYVTTGTLWVRLDNAANGFVIADAVRIVRQGVTLVAPVAPTVAHNAALPLDVNGDERISSFDALLVIRELLSPSPAASAAAPLVVTAAASSETTFNCYVDVNGDGRVSPLDALAVINYLLTPRPPADSSPAPLASPAASAASPADALAVAAVDQAISGMDDSDSAVPRSADEPVVAPAVSTASPSAPAQLILSPSSVRAAFASAAKKNGAQSELDPDLTAMDD